MNEAQMAKATKMVEEAFAEENERRQMNQTETSVMMYIIGLATGIAVMGVLWNFSVGNIL